jgi:hypothetical protein
MPLARVMLTTRTTPAVQGILYLGFRLDVDDDDI